jgi:hypothetical protein
MASFLLSMVFNHTTLENVVCPTADIIGLVLGISACVAVKRAKD